MSQYSQLYQNQSNFFKNHSYKQTSIGLVAIIPFCELISPGWRQLTIQQGTLIKNQLISLVSTWGIVAFSSGKLDGSGYGNNISNNYGNQCGQRFVIYQSCAPLYLNQQNSSYYFSKSNSAPPSEQIKLNNYDKVQNQYLSNTLQDYQKINTPIGLVVKVPFHLPIPQGFRILSLGQGVEIKQYLTQILNQWSIVAFEHGKIDGDGYGNKINQTYGQQCGQKFIVSINK